MKRLKRALVAVGALLVVAGALLAIELRHPSLEPHRARFSPSSEGTPRVTWLGVSSLLIDDGETALMTDGFFSRPGKLKSFLGKVAPDDEAISRQLARAHVGKLAAVIAVHSHYDHAMDSPEVARRTGALVIGTQSTANIARGAGLPEAQIRVARDGEVFSFGKFRVTLLRARHIDHGVAMGEIAEPLVPPAPATAYKEGGSWSVLVERDGKTLLIQGSAGFVEGALNHRKAELVFLSVAMLGKKDAAYREAYWREVVRAVGARRVVPIHWDDFSLPLDEPLRPLPALFDDFSTTLRFLDERGAKDGVEIKLLDAFVPFAL